MFIGSVAIAKKLEGKKVEVVQRRIFAQLAPERKDLTWLWSG